MSPWTGKEGYILSCSHHFFPLWQESVSPFQKSGCDQLAMFPSGLDSSQPAQHHRRSTAYVVNKEAPLRAGSAGLHPDSQTWSALDTPEHGGRVRPAHMALLGWQHRCPAGLGLCQAPSAVWGIGSHQQPRGVSCAPAHLGEQAEQVTPDFCSHPRHTSSLPAPTH